MHADSRTEATSLTAYLLLSSGSIPLKRSFSCASLSVSSAEASAASRLRKSLTDLAEAALSVGK